MTETADRPQWVSVLVLGRVVDRACRYGDVLTLSYGPRGTCDIPWAWVKRWRVRESFHRFGSAAWHDGPAALGPVPPPPPPPPADARQPEDPAPTKRDHETPPTRGDHLA